MDAHDEIRRLKRRLERERKARREAETIAERATRQLYESNEELLRFARVVAHDLKGPLRTVTAFTQLLSMRYADKLDEKGALYIDTITGGVHRTIHLIDELQRYARATTDTAPRDIVRLGEVLGAVEADLMALISEQGATIERSELPEVRGNAVQLGLIFQNLITNAIRYRSDAAPVVRISAERDSEAWVICVADNGRGIPKQFHQTIFNIFDRGDADRDEEGTGVGLAIVERIAFRHSGRVWVESEPGQGSQFYVRLPA